MRHLVSMLACGLLLGLSVGVVSADTIVSGNLKVKDGGSIIFPDNTVQKTAQVKGDKGDPGPANSLTIGNVATGNTGTLASATITGTAPNQVLNLILPQGSQGIQGPAGPTVSWDWPWKMEAYSSSVPAIGNSPAYMQTSTAILSYDTTGKNTGFVHTGFYGGTPVMSVFYYTGYDSHSNPTSGIVTASNSTALTTITQSYTYDANGNKTQRVRNYFDSNGNLYRTLTRNYDLNNKGAITSEIDVRGTITTTTIYSYSSYDANGFPTVATTSTKRVDSLSPDPPITWSGGALFEFEQIVKNL